MKKYKEMNGNEKIAYIATKRMFDYMFGGWYNCTLDGYEEDIPETAEQAKQLVYEASMTDYYDGHGHYSCGRTPLEMRFAGEAFIREVIETLFAKDEWGDVESCAEVKGW